jgi:hypothetical protein
MRLGLLLAAGLCAPLSGGASEAPCARCHPAETKLHEQTRMAHAMLPAALSAFGQDLPTQPLHESTGGYFYTYRVSPFGPVFVSAARNTDRAEGKIDWVMGAGAQGQTPLVAYGDAVLESRVSYFPGLGRFGITIGQNAGPSTNALAALGVKQAPDALRGCLNCHATGVTQGLQPVLPGIQCERCHAGAAAHAAGKGAAASPGKMTAIDQVRFCGTCHRDKPPVDDTQLENVRFQPLRLMKSRCFVSGKLACTTCHLAHQDARRNDAVFYNSKCLTCHTGQAGALHHSDSRQTGDCISCHMPYVELHPALHFTDHDIRVVKLGDLPTAAILKIRPGAYSPQ